jgi:hypothetical protein
MMKECRQRGPMTDLDDVNATFIHERWTSVRNLMRSFPWTALCTHHVILSSWRNGSTLHSYPFRFAEAWSSTFLNTTIKQQVKWLCYGLDKTGIVIRLPWGWGLHRLRGPQPPVWGGGGSDPGIQLTIHLYPVSMLRIIQAIPPLPTIYKYVMTSPLAPTVLTRRHQELLRRMPHCQNSWMPNSGSLKNIQLLFIVIFLWMVINNGRMQLKKWNV